MGIDTVSMGAGATPPGAQPPPSDPMSDPRIAALVAQLKQSQQGNAQAQQPQLSNFRTPLGRLGDAASKFGDIYGEAKRDGKKPFANLFGASPQSQAMGGQPPDPMNAPAPMPPMSGPVW